MKNILSIILLLLLFTQAHAQNRFPRPDFESGYQYPELTYPVPNEKLWTIIDILLLTALMTILAHTALRRRTRTPVLWVSITSIAYFGFFRKGCVCSIGAIQNIALSLTDSSYTMPLTALLIFILPVLFAFLFGRVFCAGACPFGALQDLFSIKNCKLPPALATALGIIPWIYLILAILFSVTQSSFIICRFDPFIGIFRLGGDTSLIIFGALLLIAGIFTGRPYCRFICPYGALLSLFSRFSIWKIKLTGKQCINCNLCHNACPVNAIKPPFSNTTGESRRQGVRRILIHTAVLPLLILIGALLARNISSQLSRVHKDIRLYDIVLMHEQNPQDILSVELEAFYGQGGEIEKLAEICAAIQSRFRYYATIAGASIGCIIGLVLIGLSVKRTRKEYEIDHASCVACGKCFSYCPQNQEQR